MLVVRAAGVPKHPARLVLIIALVAGNTSAEQKTAF
jgi:hypothetical protein